jgi:hypothetical protein
MRLFDLSFARRVSIQTDLLIKGPRGLRQKLLLPGIDLVRVNLIALRQIGHRCQFRTASKAIFAFRLAPIFRLVFFVIIRSVYQTERLISNLAHGPKIGVHFISSSGTFSRLASDTSTPPYFERQF